MNKKPICILQAVSVLLFCALLFASCQNGVVPSSPTESGVTAGEVSLPSQSAASSAETASFAESTDKTSGITPTTVPTETVEPTLPTTGEEPTPTGTPTALERYVSLWIGETSDSIAWNVLADLDWVEESNTKAPRSLTCTVNGVTENAEYSGRSLIPSVYDRGHDIYNDHLFLIGADVPLDNTYFCFYERETGAFRGAKFTENPMGPLPADWTEEGFERVKPRAEKLASEYIDLEKYELITRKSIVQSADCYTYTRPVYDFVFRKTIDGVGTNDQLRIIYDEDENLEFIYMTDLERYDGLTGLPQIDYELLDRSVETSVRERYDPSKFEYAVSDRYYAESLSGEPLIITLVTLQVKSGSDTFIEAVATPI